MICFCIGDVGAVNALVPVIRLLQEKRVLLEVYADPAGKGKKVLTDSGIKFKETFEFSDMDKCQLIVCGTNGKACDLQINATKFGKEHKIPVIWVEDFYLTSCNELVRNLHPDWICVMDEPAKKLVRRVRPQYASEWIRVLGQPAFDELYHLVEKREKRRDSIRSSLKVSENQKLVVFSASSGKQMDMIETLNPLLFILRQRSDIIFAPRFHPADPDKDIYTDCCRSHFLHGRIIDTRDENENWLALASDLFIVQYSTGGVKSALMGVPTLFVLLSTSQKYQESRGAVHPYFPTIEFGAALGVFQAQDLEQVINDLLDNEDCQNKLSEARKQHFQLDGKATQRVSDFILSFVQ